MGFRASGGLKGVDVGIAGDKGYEQDAGRLQAIRYSHDAMIDLIIANPSVKQNELAAEFGYSVPWISRVYGSDSFQARLAERKAELVDPSIVESINSRLNGLAVQSLEVLSEKLAATNSADLAIKTLDITMKSLGFGARDAGVKVQNNFVVQMPGKAATAGEWARAYGPGGMLIEADAGIDTNG